jgi:hypothetical protein
MSERPRSRSDVERRGRALKGHETDQVGWETSGARGERPLYHERDRSRYEEFGRDRDRRSSPSHVHDRLDGRAPAKQRDRHPDSSRNIHGSSHDMIRDKSGHATDGPSSRHERGEWPRSDRSRELDRDGRGREARHPDSPRRSERRRSNPPRDVGRDVGHEGHSPRSGSDHYYSRLPGPPPRQDRGEKSSGQKRRREDDRPSHYDT